MNLKNKLTVMSAISVVAVAALAILVLLQLSALIDQFSSFKATSVTAEKYTIMINRDVNYASRVTRSIMLGDNFDDNLNKLEDKIADISTFFNHLKSTVSQIPDGEEELMLAISNSFKNSLQFLEEGRQMMLDLRSNHADPQARANAWQNYKTNISPIANESRTSFSALQNLLGKHIANNEERLKAAIADVERLEYIISIVVLGVFLLGIFTTLLLNHSFAHLGDIRSAMQHIGKSGDLTQRIEIQGDDEISQTASIFNGMIEQFQVSILQVAQTITKLTDSSHDLSQVAQQGIQEQDAQGAEIENVVTSMTQLNDSVDQVRQSAEDATQRVVSAQALSKNGIELTTDAVQLMQNLAEQTEHTSSVVKQLNESCANISQVLSVIESVSEQTNLLALNAAIEAARAGEQGRGFAVVADEVRTLATRSKDSTSEIQKIIENLHQRSGEAVDAMDNNLDLSNQSVATTQEIRSSMDNVVDVITEISKMNKGITDNTRYQGDISTQVNSNMHSIQALSKKSQEGAKDAQASSAKLDSLAASLETLVERFRYQ